MNRLKLTILFFVGVFQTTYGQFTDYSGAKNYRTQFGSTQQIFTNISDVNGEANQRPFEGEAFLNEDWESYLVSFTFEGETVRLPEAKFDALYRELIFMYEGEKRKVPQKYVKGFYIEGEAGSPDIQFINLSLYGIPDSDYLSMCEVLVSGEVFLLRERHMKIREGSGKYDPASGGTELEPKLTDESRYYLVKANQLYAIPSRGQFWRILQTLGENSFDVKAYAKEYQLKVKKVEDWPMLVEAFNGRRQ